jgi:hypothetical protein
MTACAEEPPPERYTGEIEAQQEQERLSLKDTWDNGTTVHRVAPAPAQVVYAPLPEPRPAPVVPERPRVVMPAPSPAPPAKPIPAKPAPPDLAISAPPVARSPPVPQPKALTENDLQQDTARCGIGVDCLALLRAMVADPTQSWMMRAPTPQEFSNGTRLFAYRALRKTLDCGKLRFASAELDWALDTFGREVDGMQPAQRARVAALAGEVRAELQAEIKQRC